MGRWAAGGQRGRSQPIHAVHGLRCPVDTRRAEARRAGAGSALERWAQAGGRAPPEAWRVHRTPLPRTRRACFQARALAPESRGCPRGRPQGREADAASDELAAAMQRIGELSMENELLRAKMERPNGPLARRRWR